MKAFIFDIDGTLSLVGDRAKYLQQSPKDWDSFYNACDEDEPNIPIMVIYQALRRSLCTDYAIILLTGRRESTRAKTETWLRKYGIVPDILLMRSDGDYRPDTELKPELLEPYDIAEAVVFEDRNSVVKMWRNVGYTCLQVAYGDF